MSIENTIASDLMDIKQCSEYLGLSIQRLRKMCFKKQIPFKKFGRTVRFYKPEITKWVINNQGN